MEWNDAGKLYNILYTKLYRQNIACNQLCELQTSVQQSKFQFWHEKEKRGREMSSSHKIMMMKCDLEKNLKLKPSLFCQKVPNSAAPYNFP